MKRKRILTIGAYERDNFGDLLFFLMTKLYLSKHHVVAGSIMYADMERYFGETVLPYNILLERFEWDAVWVVGGEVGGVSMDMAYYGMSLGAKAQKQYIHADTHTRKHIRQVYGGAAATDPAYLPVLSRFSRNKNTPLIVNSVGVSNLDRSEALLAKESLEVLRNASSLSVRDDESDKFCKKHNADSMLAPDLIHAISLRYPEDGVISPIGKLSKKYALFQISEHLIRQYSIEQVADAVCGLVGKLDVEIALFAAGTAPGHDNYLSYYAIQRVANKRLGGSNKITVIEERRPLALVEYIKYCQLWVGSSLHGRIIACAYNVPRISLENKKVYNYARHWDEQFPINVPLCDVGVAAETALTLASNAKVATDSLMIAKAADDNMKRIMKEYEL